MLFTASISFVTSYLSFLITLITVTPGGRDNHGCSQKLSQRFIFHQDAEKSLCPSPESLEPAQMLPWHWRGLIQVPMGQHDQGFSSQNLHASFIHGDLPNKSLTLPEPSSTNSCIWANSGSEKSKEGLAQPGSCFAPTHSSALSACSTDTHKAAYRNKTQT